jgi:hypothetical protein
MNNNKMTLEQYFFKIKKLTEALTAESVVVVSLETFDGGKAGLLNELPKELAAKWVVEDRVRLASDQESAEYRTAQAKQPEAIGDFAEELAIRLARLATKELKAKRSRQRGRK